MIGPLLSGFLIGAALSSLWLDHSDRALVYAVLAVAIAVFHVSTRLPR